MLVPFVFFTAGLTLTTGVVVAQNTPAPGPGQTSISVLDANKDGSISRIEATSLPELNAQFTLLDQNQNGALEPAEFAQFERFDPADRDTRPPPTGATPAPGARRPNPPPLGSTPPPDASTPPPDGSTPPPVPR